MAVHLQQPAVFLEGIRLERDAAGHNLVAGVQQALGYCRHCLGTVGPGPGQLRHGLHRLFNVHHGVHDAQVGLLQFVRCLGVGLPHVVLTLIVNLQGQQHHHECRDDEHQVYTFRTVFFHLFTFVPGYTGVF